jgi:TatD DNase family protein
VELFDSHCHLTDASFAADVPAVLAHARDAGVRGFVTIASDVHDADNALELARSQNDVWCTAGIHPHVAADAIEADFAQIEALSAQERVVAIGETGLDYHYNNSPRDVQRRVFERQLALAERTGLPVVVHCRDADADMIAVLHSVVGRVRGVLHCFTGGAPLLEAGLAADWYIAFGGLVTFKNFAGSDLLRAVPEDRLLLETDSPYLAPVPMRGKRNEPAFLVHTCAQVARLRGCEPEALALTTNHNTRALFAIGP